MLWINHPSTSDGWNPHHCGVPTKVRVGVPATIVCFCRFMDSRSAPMWEHERHAPVRAHSAEDSGGAPGPSTSKGEWELEPKKSDKLSVCLCHRTLGWAMRQKARRLALVKAAVLFFCVVSCWQNVKICEGLLGMPSFQCIGGGSVPPPITC